MSRMVAGGAGTAPLPVNDPTLPNMRIRHSLAALGLACMAPAAAAAQTTDDALARPIRAHVGVNGYYAQPVGDFADRIDQGWGGELNGTWLVGEAGVFGLRFDGGAMAYGRQRTRECLTTSCLVEVDITTSNNLAYVAVGPQLMAPAGPIRPYVAGQVGWTFLWTDSRVEGSNNQNEPFASTRNFSDNTFSYGGTGGLLIPLVQNARNPVSIDLGVRYLRNGNVEYLRKGDIIINPGGPPTFNVQRSRADLLTYHVGVSVAVR